MKKIFTLLLVFFAVLALKAQETQAFLTFENGVAIPDGITGVTSVSGSGDALIKNDATYTQTANAIIDDGGENVLFMDYHGYLKFDHTILNKNAFTVIADYKWYGNGVWWLGVLTIAGNDENGPADDNVDAGYYANNLQIKDAAGTLNGLGLDMAEVIFTPDAYHHFALSYNSGEFKLYLDGVEKASSIGQVFHTWSNVDLIIGAKMNIDIATGELTPSLDGGGNCKSTRTNIDNVGLFNRALTAEEIASIAAGTSVPTDIEEGSESKVNIYPNPVTDIINITGVDVVSADVYNMAGVKVLSKQNLNGQVDAGDLASGVYLINCTNSKGEVVLVRKLIKK